MKLITQLKLNIGYTVQDIYSFLKKKYNISFNEITDMHIVKESIDSRHKPDIFYSVNIALQVNKKSEYKLNKFKDYVYDTNGLEYKVVPFNNFKRPVVVGFGPAGMFCALTLALCGLNPIIIEQGKNVDDRKRDIDNFFNNRVLDESSNVQFGEGGAGTFSDGKLNSNLDNDYCKKVINEFILAGAPKEIFYRSKPHIGSDNLPVVVKNIREKIISLGGEVRFSNQLTDIIMNGNKVTGVQITDLNSQNVYIIETDALILCIGHSAIKTFQMLKSKNFFLEQKPFAMGVRVEQLQSDINIMQYGKIDNRLPSADYKLVEHLPSGRSVFTFCMCPGGTVVSSASEKNTIVTNGMSYFARNLPNANSALLVNILPEDFGSDDPLAGLYYQRKYERLAFQIAGGDYSAPYMSVADFMNRKNLGEIQSSFKPALKKSDLSCCLPGYVTDSLKQAIDIFQKKYNGFIKDNNLLIGIESRSSSPVKITRAEDYQSLNVKGVFPVGEGAGYAGGIMSSAQDGIKAGENVVKYLSDIYSK